MRSIGCLAVAALLFGACGGGSGNQQDAGVQEDAFHQWDVYHPPQTDGPPQQDTGPVSCLVAQDYGALGVLDGFVNTGSDVTDVVTYIAALDGASAPDLLWVELYNGYGVFENGIKPGTYQLTGDELDYAMCGACVTLTANYNMTTGEWQQDYMATGGTLTITEVEPRVIGTLSNVTFNRAVFEQSGQTLYDDCTSAVTSGEFDAWFGATATFKIIGLTDFHGQLDTVGGTTPKGGAAVLSAYVAQERNSCTLVVGAGDMVGASPPLSSFFNEEPAIKALNLIGLDVTALGNHEFDKGLTALNSLITLAEFDYTSANLTNIGTELPGAVAPYVIYDVLDIGVAVIGITDTDLADVTLAANRGTLAVADQAATITAVQNARAAAATAGATIFIGAFHAGANPGGTTGQLLEIANALTGFDAFIGGHTHYADLDTTTTTGGVPIVQPNIKGQAYARISLTVNTETGVATARDAEIVQAVAASVTPDAAVVSMLAPYRADLAPILDVVIGQTTATFPRDGSAERLAESALGNLVADALKATYSTDFAYINSGTLRAPLPSTYTPTSGTPVRPPDAAPWDLLKGDIYELLPFGNMAVTRTITGAQLWAMLENGFSQLPAANGRFPQVAGFIVTYNPAATAGSRVVSVTLPDGTTAVANDGNTTYSLATVDFVNLGGDGYTMLADGAGVQQALMPEVVIGYVDAQNTVSPSTTPARIVAQ